MLSPLKYFRKNKEGTEVKLTDGETQTQMAKVTDEGTQATPQSREKESQTAKKTIIPGNRADPEQESLTLTALIATLRENADQRGKLPALFDMEFLAAATDEDKELKKIKKAKRS